MEIDKLTSEAHTQIVDAVDTEILGEGADLATLVSIDGVEWVTT